MKINDERATLAQFTVRKQPSESLFDLCWRGGTSVRTRLRQGAGRHRSRHTNAHQARKQQQLSAIGGAATI